MESGRVDPAYLGRIHSGGEGSCRGESRARQPPAAEQEEGDLSPSWS